MHVEALERLLTTLDVALHGFAVCNVAADARLSFEPMNMVVIHYVLQGEGRLEAGGVTQAFGPGHILVVPAGCGQALAGSGAIVRTVQADEHCAMLVDGLIRFDAADGGGSGTILTICSTLSATYGGSFGLFDTLAAPLVRDMTGLPPVCAAFDQLLGERAHPDIGTHALTEALMKQCLILLVRRELRSDIVDSPLFVGLRDKRLAAAVREVLRAPAAPRTVEELARIAGMSRSAFAAAFSSAFGQSPMDFVGKTRLHLASKLLIGTGLPVKAIAASMGFASRSHFSRAFRRAYGVDPTAFRRRWHDAPPDAPAASGRHWFARATSDEIGGTRG